MSENVTPNDAVRTIAIPSDRAWFDPRLITANTSIVQTDVTLVMNTPTPLCEQNPRRIMLGVAFLPSPTALYVAPWPDVAAFALDTSNLATRALWYKLFDYGPVVCNRWYGLAAGGLTVRVIEVLRN